MATSSYLNQPEFKSVTDIEFAQWLRDHASYEHRNYGSHVCWYDHGLLMAFAAQYARVNFVRCDNV
jgi:hypothetical protein